MKKSGNERYQRERLRTWICLFFLLFLFFSPFNVFAITWNFDEEGNTQGWRVRESGMNGAPTGTLYFLHSDVHDGIWYISLPPFEPKRNPSVSLISPKIGYDSSLFDQISIRFRLVHTRPIKSLMRLTWTNHSNHRSPGKDPAVGKPDSEIRRSRFEIVYPQIYTTEWQEATITGLQNGKAPSFNGEDHEILWKGELIDIRVDMLLASISGEHGFIEGPEEVPQAIEIDWIELTGVKEELQGELSSPTFLEPATFGDLLLPAVFCPLGERGMQLSAGVAWLPTAVLGDWDGDEDADLISVWQGRHQGVGWLVASNDGSGRFVKPDIRKIEGQPIIGIEGEDLDEDGRLDMILSRGLDTQILLNDEEEGLIKIQEMNNLSRLGVADADGDGMIDLLMTETLFSNFPSFANISDPDFSSLWKSNDTEVWLFCNNGSGKFFKQRNITIDSSEENFSPFRLVTHLRQGKVTGVLRCSNDPEKGYIATYIDEKGKIEQIHLAVHVNPFLIQYIGDFDLDGDIDLIVGDEWISSINARLVRGLNWVINAGNGTFDTVRWNGEVELYHYVKFFDLNEDGLLDPIFVDNNERNPAVIVHLGQLNDLPVQEGRYPLAGVGGEVLGDDLDLDGDLDLVVLERSVEGRGGVHVLFNNLDKFREE